MNCFSSLDYVPAETRKLLRSRFARNLSSHPSHHYESYREDKTFALNDELILHLLLNLNIEVQSDFEKAKIAYLEAYPTDSDEPSFEKLITAGWIRVVWGRIVISSEIARSVPPGSMTAFESLLARRFDEKYHLTRVVRNNPKLAKVVAAIDGLDEHSQLPSNVLSCQSPEWVAARLWDRTFHDSSDINAALRTWVDRWNLLMSPLFRPGRVWSKTAAKTFREAVINILETDQDIMNWEQMRSHCLTQIALIHGQSPSNFEKYIPLVPANLVKRALWLEDRSVEKFAGSVAYKCDNIFGLVGLILSDVEIEEIALPPHKIMSKMVKLSTDRPELLLTLLFRVRSNPVLLADLLLCPETSALASLLVAQWRLSSSAWDRELITSDDQAAKSIAFTDAVSVMGHFLRQRVVPPEEVSALLDWLHSNALRSIEDQGNSENMLVILRNELISQSTEILHALLAALIVSMPKSGIGTSAFAAALDIIDTCNLANEINPDPIISTYIQSVTSDDYNLSAHRISAGGALSLFQLSLKMPDHGQSFLSPFDIKRRISDGIAANENPYTVENNIARSIRVHIRVLSRAVSGCNESVPEKLLEALIAAIHSGALMHKEKGRVAAFSAYYETKPFQNKLDRPIAIDLSAALRALNGDEVSQLLKAILEIDEPIVLAQLLSVAPYSTREAIENRITELTPSEAGEVHSLTEIQARIEVLLSAGAVDAAAQYIEAERDLETLGKVPGREMVRLRALLHWQLLKNDWDGIAKAEAPDNLSPIEKDSANDTIRFFKALAELRKPNGNLEYAEYWFSRFQKRHPQVVAYASNLFAAQLIRLLNGDSFMLLDAAQVVHARQILENAEKMMSCTQGMSTADSDIFNANKVLILLAMGQAEQADLLLRPLLAARPKDNFTAYSAVALSRMGRTTEANAVLAHAEQMFGPTEVIKAAKSQIESGTPYLASANIISKDDQIRSIKAALFDLKQMPPIQQADVLKSPPDPFDAFVIEIVREATASVVSLRPMMKNMVIDSCEDDFSAFIRELLIPRFSFLGWSCTDQSKGGYSAKGNPGERDLLILRDSYILAVIEAVVCNPSVNWSNLRSHFQKMLGYSTCSLFFHLTYSYIENPDSILPKLKESAKNDAPDGFDFIAISDIPLTDSRPTGFFARYNAQFGEIKVVFLVLNLGQHDQKRAAKIAGG